MANPNAVADEKLMHSIQSSILEVLGASGPCTYRDLVNECDTQVIGFETYHGCLFIDKILNKLIRKNTIVLEGGYSEHRTNSPITFDMA